MGGAGGWGFFQPTICCPMISSVYFSEKEKGADQAWHGRVSLMHATRRGMTMTSQTHCIGLIQGTDIESRDFSIMYPNRLIVRQILIRQGILMPCVEKNTKIVSKLAFTSSSGYFHQYLLTLYTEIVLVGTVCSRHAREVSRMVRTGSQLPLTGFTIQTNNVPLHAAVYKLAINWLRMR